MVVIRWETRSRRSYVRLDHPPLQGNNARIDKNMSESRRDKCEIIDRKLTYFCHFGQITFNCDIFCQLTITLDNSLSIFWHLSRLDSDMFLSIQALFPYQQICGQEWNLIKTCVILRLY